MQRFDNGVDADLIKGAVWRKSGRSNADGNCVEVAKLEEGAVAVRNSRYPSGPALIYTRAEAAAFIQGTKDGDFDFVLN
ncbi:DUF397 domain-containing protein [Streptomyces celluloflavus]|uniref:DUF397 domain-containing protein n=1 Tax=Streptomyces celluloflavus TaxID=58344 RepID=UPI00345F6761|nr:DUF397 domain-containing protein [Streptomyces celluloflavus]